MFTMDFEMGLYEVVDTIVAVAEGSNDGSNQPILKGVLVPVRPDGFHKFDEMGIIIAINIVIEFENEIIGFVFKSGEVELVGPVERFVVVMIE
jgi:hypothetical protein